MPAAATIGAMRRLLADTNHKLATIHKVSYANHCIAIPSGGNKYEKRKNP